MQLTVVSYNVWDLPIWLVPKRRERMLAIAQYFKRLNPDIILLQEAWDIRNVRLIDGALADQYSFSTSRRATRHFLRYFRTNAGGLLILSKFPIVSQRFKSFRPLPWRLDEAFANKGSLEAVIDSPLGQIRVVNLHLYRGAVATGDRKRLQQLNQALQQLTSQPDIPTILAGDFNRNNLLQELRYAKLLDDNGFKHAADSDSVSLPPTYRIDNPFSDTWINRFPDKAQNSERLDYFFVKQLDKLGLKVDSYAPDYIKPELSDHDPLILTLGSS